MVSCEVERTRSSLTRFHPHHRKHAIVIFFHSLELGPQLGGKSIIAGWGVFCFKITQVGSGGYIL